MCLAIPGKLTRYERGNRPAMGLVDFDGIRKRVCLELVPDVREGDYVIVHVGFALQTIDEQEAKATIEMLRSIGSEPEDLDGGMADRS